MSETGRPGRYQRSATGLIGALLVTVAAVGAFFLLQELFRDDLEVRPGAVDHLEVVEAAQQAGIEPVYPASLPEGWIATRADGQAGPDPVLDIAMLTDDDRFVGLVWSRESADTLLRERVDDKQVEEAEPLTVEGSVAGEWEGYADPGGDRAYVAERGPATVMVYGSAPAEDLVEIIERLTTAPVSR